MYNEMTYETILQRMLDRVPEDIDKREGSVIYDALAPAAIELANMYIALDNILSNSFADTASRDYLILRAAERGIIPTEATCPFVKAVFNPSNIDIPVGSRFSCNNLNYTVIDKMENGEYKLQCETLGTEGNNNFGDLISIDYIQDLESAEITELLISGENEEDTEVFRQRYFDSITSQAFGGNVTDYKEKVLTINGVGGVKVYPNWNGGGTVKLVIIDSSYTKPSTLLIENVQSIIDPLENSGMGEGIAPIGHKVTVVGCEETVINLELNITYENEWTFEDVQDYIEQVINEYFTELAEKWALEENIIVRISQIETRILNLSGIIDISNTLLNDKSENLILDKNNIPILGVVENV